MPKPYMPHPALDRHDAHELVWATAPELPPPPVVWFHTDRPPVKRSAPVLLSRQEELVLFLRFNYARKRAQEDDSAQWAARAGELEEAAVRYNVGLVFSALHAPEEDTAAAGMEALLRSVRAFDVGRGWKFSTFATQAIRNAAYRLNQRRRKRPCRLVSEDGAAAALAGMAIAQHRDARSAESAVDDADELRGALAAADLTDEERHVLARQYLAPGATANLATIGGELGVSKERARQLRESAIGKVRAVIQAPSYETAPPEPSPRGA